MTLIQAYFIPFITHTCRPMTNTESIEKCISIDHLSQSDWQEYIVYLVIDDDQRLRGDCWLHVNDIIPTVPHLS